MKNILLVLSIISGAGGFGGLVYGLFSRNSYKLRLPFYGKLIEIGFLGDILVGIAASITVFFIAGPLFSLKLTEISDPECYIKIIALGVLSGFTGIRLLSGMSSKLLERISAIDERLDHVEKQDRIGELLRQADFLLNNNPDRSLIIYNKYMRNNTMFMPIIKNFIFKNCLKNFGDSRELFFDSLIRLMTGAY